MHVVTWPLVVATMAKAVVMGRVDFLILLAVLSVFAVVAAAVIMLPVRPTVLAVVVAADITWFVRPSVLAVVVAADITRLARPSVIAVVATAVIMERTRRRRGSAYQPARGRDGRGFVNGVPDHQAPRAPAAHHGPQWWTQPQAGLGEMSRKLLFSLFSFLILQCIIGSP
jgi:hypothetical protein